MQFERRSQCLRSQALKALCIAIGLGAQDQNPGNACQIPAQTTTAVCRCPVSDHEGDKDTAVYPCQCIICIRTTTLYSPVETVYAPHQHNVVRGHLQVLRWELSRAEALLSRLLVPVLPPVCSIVGGMVIHCFTHTSQHLHNQIVPTVKPLKNQ